MVSRKRGIGGRRRLKELHHYKGYDAAIPIKGQHFLAPDAGRIWTRTRRANYALLIMIKQIKFVSIPVADQNRALDFYTEKLGFTIITDQPFDEKQRWIELRVPKAETRGGLFTAEGRGERGWA